MPFQFEKLEVYQKSLDWVESVETLCEFLKGKACYSLIDQFSRAALSIPLNIAEGNGRWHKGEKRQFFWGSSPNRVGKLEELKAVQALLVAEKKRIEGVEELGIRILPPFVREGRGG